MLGTREERAAYGYYCKSRRANQHEPVSFEHWQRTVYPGQVGEMVQFKCAVPWEPDCELGYSLAHLRSLMGTELYERFEHWLEGQGQPVCRCAACVGAPSPHDDRKQCGPHGAVVWETDLDRFMRWSPRETKPRGEPS